mmetsp:Transcript_35750/g.83728  ORF Transcript_35750/g.83728 Transcript_35750/m.83728 type:complete len:574 (+) Transcript_35750:162-1883(+)
MATDAKGATLAVGARAMVLNKHTCTIRFLGSTEFAEGDWVGVELDKPNGKNDGSIKGVCYFSCPENHGLFVRPGGGIELLQELTSAIADEKQQVQTKPDPAAADAAKATKRPGGLLGRIAPRSAKKTAGEKAAAEAAKTAQQMRTRKPTGNLDEATQGCIVHSTLEDPGFTVFITIISARNLPVRNLERGSSDPYCIVQIAGKVRTKRKTRVIKNTVNPEWDEVHQIDDYKVGEDLQFVVKDMDALKAGDDVLGKATLAGCAFASGFSDDIILESAAGDAGADSASLKVSCKLQGKDPELTVKVDNGPLGISISWRGEHHGLVVTKMVPGGGIERISDGQVKLGWRLEAVNGSAVESLEDALTELKYRPVTVKFIGNRADDDNAAAEEGAGDAESALGLGQITLSQVQEEQNEDEPSAFKDADLDADVGSTSATATDGAAAWMSQLLEDTGLEFPKAWKRRQTAQMSAQMELSIYSEMLERLNQSRMLLQERQLQESRQSSGGAASQPPIPADQVEPFLRKTAANIQRRVEAELQEKLPAKMEAAVAAPLAELKGLLQELKAKRAAAAASSGG